MACGMAVRVWFCMAYGRAIQNENVSERSGWARVSARAQRILAASRFMVPPLTADSVRTPYQFP